MYHQADLFERTISAATVEPVIPTVHTHENWPPDYRGIYAWRIKTLATLRNDPAMLADAHAYYAKHPAEFIMHWCDTYNPRKQREKWMPFIFFYRQYELVQFFEDLRRDNENGLVEKCRDMGATWVACAYSVWTLCYVDDDATGWGSRKENLVDKLGDADSIFEKIRLLIARLPDVFKPEMTKAHMKIANKVTGATITGESGDNIGRGGRKSRYFKDEAAHYERPELIEAALGDNTDVQIDISSVNGLGNVFHRRREAGIEWQPDVEMPPGMVRVFIMDWRDHPEKTQAWYDQRKARAEREGMQHIFAQEVDRNYSAAVDNTVISYEWIEAAVDAHLKLPILLGESRSEFWMAGLDVADEGTDRNAMITRQGIIARYAEEWGERDPGVTTRRMFGSLRERNLHRLDIQYDCIGIGAAVRSEYNRLCEEGIISYGEYNMVPWHAGAAVVNPFARVIPDDSQSSLNRDFFYNMKAQAWWAGRTRFYKTWRAITFGEIYDVDELVSLDSKMPLLHQLKKELAQPTRGTSASTLKMVINKTPPGTKSPNLADAFIECYFPAPQNGATAESGSYGG